MGNNYDFRFNEPPLNSKRIEQHKDFSALLQKYQAEPAPDKKKKRPGMRVVWLGLTTAVAAAIALLLIIRPFGSEVDTNDLFAAQDAYFAEQAFIQPPIPPANPPVVKKTMRAEQGGAYKLNANLSLVIPEMAFMDDRGREITGEVDLEYREMHDPIDFFLSGIPMYYDSLGQKYQMESAGMIEIFGFQEGNPVQLAPGKTIKVELISKAIFSGESLAGNFSLFQLDTFQRRWVRSDLPVQQAINYSSLERSADLDQVAFLQLLAEAEADAITQAEQNLPVPQKPINTYEKPASAPSFSLQLDDIENADAETQSILEQEDLTGVWWFAEGQSYDISVLQAGWPEVQLRNKGDNLFEMTLIAGDSSLQLLLHPVLVGPELEEATEAFQVDLANYTAALQTWDQELTARKKNIRDSFALKRQELLNEQAAAVQSKRRGTITSSFEVNAFGIWNCDRLLVPGEVKVIEKLEDQKGQVYQNHTAYLLDKNTNTLYHFYAGKKALVEVPQSKDMMIWVVDKDNKIAVLPQPIDQEKLMDNSLETLQLEWQDIELSRPGDIRALLDKD